MEDLIFLYVSCTKDVTQVEWFTEISTSIFFPFFSFFVTYK